MAEISKTQLQNELEKLKSENNKLNIELKKVNEALKYSESMRSHFLSNIKNEINNPMSAVMSLTEGLDAYNIDPMIARVLRAEFFNLNFQLSNIFFAAELESGEAFVSPSKTNIPKLIQKAIDLHFYKMDEKKIKLKLDIDKNLDEEYFMVDAEKLGIVFSNIFSNAIVFNEPEGSIFVTVKHADKCLLLQIEDNGEGIPEEKLKNIYDRFQQLETGFRKKHMGHGIGLSVVQAIVQMLEGNIEISSKLGGGSTFTVYLPTIVADDDTIAEDDNEFFFDDDEFEIFEEE